MLQPTATTYRGKVFQDCSQATPRQRENGASPETYCLWRRELLGCTAALLASSVVFQRPAQAVIVEEEVTERVFNLAGNPVGQCWYPLPPLLCTVTFPVRLQAALSSRSQSASGKAARYRRRLLAQALFGTRLATLLPTTIASSSHSTIGLEPRHCFDSLI